MPKCSPHGWSIDTSHRALSRDIKQTRRNLSDRILALRETVQEHDDRNKERFASRTEAVKIAADATKEATDKFMSNMIERLRVLDDIMPRHEFESEHKLLEKDVQAVSLRLSTIETSKLVATKSIGTLGAILIGIFSGVTAAAAVGALILEVARR